MAINQFGRVKGCSTEHYLVLLWQKVLENLEDKRAASLLTTIVYSKAFIRLNCQKCLLSLRKKGTPRELPEIVAAFFTNRQMTVKVGEFRSSRRRLLGGVPQGSLMWVFLFNCLIDNFEAASDEVEPYLINGGQMHGQTRPQDLVHIPGLVEIHPEPHYDGSLKRSKR